MEVEHVDGVSTAELAPLLGQPTLRVYDCTTYLEPTPPGSDDPYLALPGRHGLDRSCRAVLYSIGTIMWATRCWWMLRPLGFEGAAVLDGGFDKWWSMPSGPSSTRAWSRVATHARGGSWAASTCRRPAW